MRFILSAFADEADPALSGQLSALSQNGLSLLEPRGIDGKNIGDLTVAEAKDLHRRLTDAGIGISALGSPYGKIRITDPFAPHLDAFRRTLEVARELGAARIRMFSFFLDGHTHEDCRAEVLERLDALLSAAAEAEVLCCHENEKGIYGDTLSPCLDLQRTFSGRMGCVFDPANFLQTGTPTWEAFCALKPHITYYHMKDVVAATGELVPCGEGDGEIRRILSALSAEEGETVLTLEPHLAVFPGLSGLEEDGGASLKRRHTYRSNTEAFGAAAAALKACLTDL